MRKISQLVALLVLVSFAWTQTTGKIRGTVSSSDGQALAGANVVVDGTSKGAATDADGGFTILWSGLSQVIIKQIWRPHSCH